MLLHILVHLGISPLRIVPNQVPDDHQALRYTKKGIKDCTLCTIPHRPDSAEYIKTRFAEIAANAGIAPTKPEPELFLDKEDQKDPYAVIAAWNAAIAPPDEEAAKASKAHWDGIAKPLDGLGKLETTVTRIAALTGKENVNIEKRAVAVLCADNGVVEEGVTQTDASVTATMAKNVAEHRSSVCLMAKSAKADVFSIDMGILHRVEGTIDLHVGDGTANMTVLHILYSKYANHFVSFLS